MDNQLDLTDLQRSVLKYACASSLPFTALQFASMCRGESDRSIETAAQVLVFHDLLVELPQLVGDILKFQITEAGRNFFGT